LLCYNNQLSSLDVSLDLSNINFSESLKYLQCYNNQLTSLDLTASFELVFLECSNNQLTNLDVSPCYQLESLSCGNNQLTILDVSQNNVLECLDCTGNELICLNIANGNNMNFYNDYCFISLDNPDLFCIQVDFAAGSSVYWTEIDSQQYFSEDCGDCTPTSNLTELNSNQPKELIKIVNLLGQEVEYTPNTVLIYQYSDGTSEKVFIIED